MDPDQTAHIGAVCSDSTLFASKLNLSVMLCNYLQQTTFSDAFFLGALRVKHVKLLFFRDQKILAGYGLKDIITDINP